MRTSPGPGSPTWTSSRRRTSGPPHSWKRTALAMGILREDGGARRGRSHAPPTGSEARAHVQAVGAGLLHEADEGAGRERNVIHRRVGRLVGQVLTPEADFPVARL